MTTDLAGFDATLAALHDDLSGPALRDVVERLARAAEDDMNDVVRRDVGGDRRMSGWPVKLDVGMTVTGQHEAVLAPAKGAGGAWEVLQSGRRAGAVAPQHVAAVTLRTPHGPRRFTKAHPLKIGPTAGKQTKARAIGAAVEHTPERAADELHAIYARRFEQ